MKAYELIRNMDRRVIFLLIALATSLPLIFPIPFPEVITPMVARVFDRIESMPAGSRVLVAFDYDPGSEPELQPMANSFVRHLAERRAKIYFIALWPMGQNMIRDTIDSVLAPEYPELAYGTDYVNLGYKSGGEGVIKVIQTNLGKLYTTDGGGRALSDIPMMREIKSLRSFSLIVNVSAGYPGTKEWVQYGSDPSGIPIVGGCTAVQAPLFYPYYPNQLDGLLGGIKGAAEYDEAMKKRYGEAIAGRYRQGLKTELERREGELAATATGPELQAGLDDLKSAYDQALADETRTLYLGRFRMGPQAIAHLVIMLLIVLGNVTYFIDRRRERKGSGG